VTEIEFRSAIKDLADRTNCVSFDLDLWELIFTHESHMGEHFPDQRSAVRLVEIVQKIGREAVRTAVYEYCLDQKGLDPWETAIRWQSVNLLILSIVTNFKLVSFCRVGHRFTQLDTNKNLQEALGERFLGGITVASSYTNVRQLIWENIESALFSLSSEVSYQAVDPKSWLQEYCQRFYLGKQPVYSLLSETGPEHQKLFHCRVILPDGRAAEAHGPTLKAAQKLAVVTLIEKFDLGNRLASRKTSVMTGRLINENRPSARCLDVNPGRIDKYLVRAAPGVAARLRCAYIDRDHLAVALTLPASTRKGIETNLRHKLLGDALETLSFAVFSFQALPTRMFVAHNISHFAAIICSNTHQANLFDFLDLGSIVCREPQVQLWEQGKSDVIKAIAAAVYLSTRDFSRFFDWITENLGSWCQEMTTLLAENPLSIKDSKSFLQELLQGTKLYEIEYVDRRTGPEHLPKFSTTVFLNRGGRRTELCCGTGRNLKEAQLAAATNALDALIPRNMTTKLSPNALPFWRTYFDHLLSGEPGVIVGACGVEHFKAWNSFAGYFGLKAFAKCLPGLSPYLQKPEFIDLAVRSIGKLTVGSISDVLSLGKKGIAFITSTPPDNLSAFRSQEVDDWLGDLRKASVSLKLPVSEVRYPLNLIPIAELEQVREWKLTILPGDGTTSVSESMFSHLVTLLERLNRDVSGSNDLQVLPRTGADWRSLSLTLIQSGWSRAQWERVADQLLPNAFFSGVLDSTRQGSSGLALEIKGVYFDAEEAHVLAYIEILRRLYRKQGSLQILYRIVHDLKNQVIAIRNYAIRAADEPKAKYQMFAAIEQLQDRIRGREAALRLFFSAADPSRFKKVNLQSTIREFVAGQMPILPGKVRLEFRENLGTTPVIANGELLTSLMENLTQNAVEAMPEGGILSLSAAYNVRDSMLEIDVSDTGAGIVPEALPDLFTSLRSTKAKGMGLGLATVKQIVDQHGGLIDVVSRTGAGTKFTVLLPLQTASGLSHESVSN
jgi:signal transduction histidine kinase/dsRNA-specific ribonuclease